MWRTSGVGQLLLPLLLPPPLLFLPAVAAAATAAAPHAAAARAAGAAVYTILQLLHALCWSCQNACPPLKGSSTGVALRGLCCTGCSYISPGLSAPRSHVLALSCSRAPPAGLVNVRKNVGGGSFLAGYKRHFADYSSFEVCFHSQPQPGITSASTSLLMVAPSLLFDHG